MLDTLFIDDFNNIKIILLILWKNIFFIRIMIGNARNETQQKNLTQQRN